MAILRNKAKRAFIIPFMGGSLEGLVAPGDAIKDVPDEAMKCDFVQGCIERGELEEIAEQVKRPGRPPKTEQSE